MDRAASPPLRRRLVVTGAVQGVGFRPYVYRLAVGLGLVGMVRNTPEGVVVEAQGPAAAVEAFCARFPAELPPLARIVDLASADLPAEPDSTAFLILESTAGAGHSVLISPDMATCDACLADMADPGNRRFEYPFTNCTDCGPRYTITRSIPYDRPATSMACFPLCPECAAEYHDPLDRRFHAQPNACPVCGPRLWLADREGKPLAEGREAIRQAARELAAGRILAPKGLGGFHLACDATSDAAVDELRSRKQRKAKPLALMVPDLDTARALAEIPAEEEALLSSRERPIVLCKLHERSLSRVAPLARAVSPDTPWVGLMLPYAPLHHVLLADYRAAAPGRVPALVMTSGNLSEEPIAIGNREALARLGRLADCFLFHDRDILIRADDSVCRVVREPGAAPRTQFLRRARGFTPRPVFLAELEENSSAGRAKTMRPRREETARSMRGDRSHGVDDSGAAQPTPDVQPVAVMGVGPELKNTLCLTKGNQAFVSQHIGDMENLETLTFFTEMEAHLKDILRVAPRLIVHDLHPDYLTTRWAAGQAEAGMKTAALQHHAAHAFSVLAENRFEGRALVLALDGTGYGGDGTLWGGELLLADTAGPSWERLAHLAPLRLPGGEAAIKEPWRISQAALWELGVKEPEGKPWPWLADFTPASRLVGQMLTRNLNCPASTSLGRLFDAAAALAGAGLTAEYEAQAAIRLEHRQYGAEAGAAAGGAGSPAGAPGRPGNGADALAADNAGQGPDHAGRAAKETGDAAQAYPLPLAADRTPALLDSRETLRALYEDWKSGISTGTMARRFHAGLVAGLAAAAAHFAEKTGIKTVGLSGGCLLNLTLSENLPPALRARGLDVLVHTALPPGDACISLGQADWGRRMLLGRI
jgi:hydrogenase maturation protein HypF